MGTRHLVAVIVDGTHRIAQYGQWDGQPSGQGRTVLDFCGNRLATKDARGAFAAKLRRARFVAQEEIAAAWKATGAGEWATCEQAQRFRQRFQYIDRDIGGEILKLADAYDGTDPMALRDDLDFAADSLFCEWAYVVDLDLATLEVYRGFNESPTPTGERFADMPPPRSGYWPVCHVATFRLDALPSYSDFVAATDPEDAEA